MIIYTQQVKLTNLKKKKRKIDWQKFYFMTGNHERSLYYWVRLFDYEKEDKKEKT